MLLTGFEPWNSGSGRDHSSHLSHNHCPKLGRSICGSNLITNLFVFSPDMTSAANEDENEDDQQQYQID